jgi:hypothetical protein
MKSLREGQLVTVTRDDVTLDGIVAHVPSLVKVVVAVPDAEREAILRTVHPKTLALRDEPGESDQALRRLIDRAPAGGRGGPPGAKGGAGGRRGHARISPHRTTGK